MVDARGQPYGSSIDILREAARRANIKLDWVYSPAGPDRALSDGSIDLWPLLNKLPERSRFYFTEPYAELNYWLISKNLERALDATAVGGRSVGISTGLGGRIGRAYLPQAQFKTFEGVSALVEGVCNDTVFTGVLAESITDAYLFRKPDGCQLRMSPIPGAWLSAGIGAAPKHSGAGASGRLVAPTDRDYGAGRNVLHDHTKVVRVSHERSRDGRKFNCRPPEDATAQYLACGGSRRSYLTAVDGAAAANGRPGCPTSDGGQVGISGQHEP
jgi:hypothetical protein